MKESARPLDRPTAAEYATWFKALADATRIQIVSLLARQGTPMNVGEIVGATAMDEIFPEDEDDEPGPSE